MIRLETRQSSKPRVIHLKVILPEFPEWLICNVILEAFEKLNYILKCINAATSRSSGQKGQKALIPSFYWKFHAEISVHILHGVSFLCDPVVYICILL